MTERKKVLSLCDYTGNMVMPWLAEGIECHTVDIKHPEFVRSGPLVKIGMDVRKMAEVDLKIYGIIFAFPPCTNVAVSGTRWFKSKGLDGLIEALEIFNACLKICEREGVPYMIENPVSTVSTYYRKPDYTFHPYEYGGYLYPPGDAYTKKTCLWTGNGFVMPPKQSVHGYMDIDNDYIHHMPESKDRADLRSATPLGFAYAVFNANRHVIMQAGGNQYANV